MVYIPQREETVGLFFYIRNKQLNFRGFLYHLLEENHALVYGDMLTDSCGHDDLFEQRFPGTAFEYYDFPRGRVVYDLLKKRYVIYIDACIDTPKYITAVKSIFHLESKAYVVEHDDHYVCKKCRKEIFL